MEAIWSRMTNGTTTLTTTTTTTTIGEIPSVALAENDDAITTTATAAAPFASCADGQPDHDCFHGGQCRASLETDQYYCDCSTTAVAAEPLNLTKFGYVGQWCHLLPQVLCDHHGNTIHIDGDERNAKNDNGWEEVVHFCVNGGTCQTSQGCEVVKCQCDGDFVGPHCEYHASQVVAPEQLNLRDETNNNEDIGDKEEEDTDALQCDLPCENGGMCVLPTNNDNDTDDDNDEPNAHCVCLEGFTGDMCRDVQVLGMPCGGQSCHHGSTCVRTIAGAYACDCTAAVATPPPPSSSSKNQYAGRWCQYEAMSLCDDQTGHFCVNGGTCVIENGLGSCRCDETKWTGPSCEFPIDTQDYDYQDCTTKCLNGGKCRKGAKNDRLSSSASSSSSAIVFNEDFEHCVCPKGYTGLVCERTYEECGNGEHFCLHGSKCVPQSNDGGGRDGWKCNCQEAFREDRKYAGEFCQHHHSMLCTTEDAKSSAYDPTASLAFCVNDGICLELVEHGKVHAGCSCPPGYTGAHCELLETKQSLFHGIDRTENAVDATQKSAGVILLCFALSVLLVVSVVVASLRWKGLKKREEEEAIVDEVKASVAAHLRNHRRRSSSLMEEMDVDPYFDERDLEEVELL